MNSEELENKLKTMTKPEFSGERHQIKLKMALMSSKKSARISLWLLSIPFLFLLEGLIQAVWNISILPWSLLQKYSPAWPISLRITIFMLVLIVIPLVAAIFNFLSIFWFQYDKKHKVLHISIRIRLLNLILMIAAGLLAFLFIAHSMIDWLTNSGK